MKEQERQLRAEVPGTAGPGRGDGRLRKMRTTGSIRRGDELPAEELQRRESRLKKIRAAQRALEERARQRGGAGWQAPRRSATGEARRTKINTISSIRSRA